MTWASTSIEFSRGSSTLPVAPRRWSRSDGGSAPIWPGTPVQQRIAGGCHLTRPIVDLLEAAGFTIKEVDVFYEAGATKVSGADSLGTASSP